MIKQLIKISFFSNTKEQNHPFGSSAIQLFNLPVIKKFFL